MRKAEVHKGMLVTCKRPESAYGDDSIQFTPGMIGVVGAVDVPCVTTKSGRDKSFVCVDFYTGEKERSPLHGETPWRCGLDYDNILPVKDFVVGYSNWLDTLCVRCAEVLRKARDGRVEPGDFAALLDASMKLMFTDAFADQGYVCSYCGKMFPEVNFYQFRQRR